jgi:hypothetical protein
MVGQLSCLALQVLLAAMIDSWDMLREAAHNVLHALSHPLPGYETPESVKSLLERSTKLLLSPRPHEADAGARIVSLVQNIYVAELQWSISLSPKVEVYISTPPTSCVAPTRGQLHNSSIRPQPVNTAAEGAATGSVAHSMQQTETGEVQALQGRIDFLLSMLVGLEAALKAGREDMVAACCHSFLQGRLLAMRYTCELLPWEDVVRFAALVRCLFPLRSGQLCNH